METLGGGPTGRAEGAQGLEVAREPNANRRGVGSWPLVAASVVFVVAVLYGWAADTHLYVGDDAGITLRYAERIATGKGFNYNDGEAVNGCSNPLYALIEAGLLALGVDPASTLRGIGVFSFAGTAFLLFWTLAGFYSLGSACFAVLLLASASKSFDQIFDGLETPLVIFLGALLFRAVHARGAVPTGIALGLLVANKLDGALASIAFTAVYFLAGRRFPWRVAVVALLTVLPVWAYLLFSFGSILPNSMLTKMLWQQQFWDMDSLWMHRLMSSDSFAFAYYAAWLSLLWWLFLRELRQSFPIVCVQAWFVLHMVAYATINLGGPIPWYASVPTLASVILAAFCVHLAACATFERPGAGGIPRLRMGSGRGGWRAWLVPALALALLLRGQLAGLKVRLDPPRTPHGIPLPASHDLARQAPGVWLRRNTSGEELLCSFVGLPAYEYEGPYLDRARLNSLPDPDRVEMAPYYLDIAAGASAPLSWNRDGRKLVGTFLYDAGGDRYDLYAKPDSEIVQQGLVHVVTPWARVWSVAREKDQVEAWAIGNTVLLPAGESIGFEVVMPAAPELVFRPILRRLENGDTTRVDRSRFPDLVETAADPETRALLSITINGEPTHEREIFLGEAIDPQIVVPSAPNPQAGEGQRRARRKYRISMSCKILAGDEPERLVLVLREGYSRAGELLRSEHFKLLYERCAKRVNYVAEQGLPYHVTGR